MLLPLRVLSISAPISVPAWSIVLWQWCSVPFLGILYDVKKEKEEYFMQIYYLSVRPFAL
jgi:hypothetical protein